MLEKLAKQAHLSWAGWTSYMFSKSIPYKPGTIQAEEGSLVIPKWAVDRWKRQINTPYENLTKKEKISDRVEAQKYLDILDILDNKIPSAPKKCK
jgi:hypothetical protein